MVDDPNPIVSLDTSASIDADLPCFFCGYNLRSQTPDAVCPKCNNAVKESLRRNWIGFANPVWLCKLRTGISILAWSMLAAILVCIGNIYAVITWVGPSRRIHEGDFGVLILFLAFGLSTATLASVRHLTASEFKARQTVRFPALAAWMRALGIMVGCLAVSMVNTFVIAVFYDYSSQADSDSHLLSLEALVFLLATFALSTCSVAAISLLMYLHRIARRSFRKGLARHLAVLACGTVVLVVNGLWLERTTIIPCWSRPGHPFLILAHAIYFEAPFVIAWFAYCVVVLFWFRSMLNKAIRENAFHSNICQLSALSLQPEGDGGRHGDGE